MNDLGERLAFLTRVIEKEITHLQYTDAKLFEQLLTIEQIHQLHNNPVLSEKIDAFVSRFSRLQDTLGDKLLPALLQRLGEQTGPMLYNLDKAEKFGWINAADEWMNIRMLRNQMIHDYIEDSAILHDALQTAHKFVAVLIGAGERMISKLDL